MYVYNKIKGWENASKEKCLFSKDFSRKISIGRYRNKTYKHFINLIKTAVILLAVLLVVSCGGGGGGGVVSFQNGQQIHNGGDSGGWGNGNQTGGGFGGGAIQSSNLLISQMAALNGISKVEIHLKINGVDQEVIVADATTTTDVLPKISVGDKVSGYAEIFLLDDEPRRADLDETEIALSNTLKFKVPYKYRALDAPDGSTVDTGTYFARDGINLSLHTITPITGWKCLNDNTRHMGSLVAGVRGDITLVPLYGSGEGLNAVPSKPVLFAKPDASFNDTATLTISGGSGTYIVTPDSSSASLIDCTGSGSSWTVSIKTDTALGATGKVWFADNTAVTINVTDSISGESVNASLTLKNKYTLQIGYSADVWPNTPLEFDAGNTFNFSSADTSGFSLPSGQQIVAYTDPNTATTYKATDSITFSDALGRREIYLGSRVDFAMTVTGGRGDGATHTGTAADPYILKYNGTDDTDETKITVTVTSNIGSIIARNADITGKLTIGHPGNTTATQYITINKTALAATAIPAAGLTYQIVVRDYQEGAAGAADNDAYLYASKTFWVKIPQPEFTVSFNTGTGGSTAPSAQTITCGGYATAPTANPTNSDTSLVFGGWYTSTNGGTTLSSTAYNFGTTPVTADITLYAKWLHTNFTGTAAEFLAAEFLTGNTAASSYTVRITSATPNELSSIGKALGKSSDSHYKGVYVSLDLSGCGATSIPAWAFAALDNFSSQAGSDIATYLTGVTLPSGITSIGRAAFYGCAGLTGSFTIPSTVSVIEDSIFNNCTGITGLTIENGVQKIGGYAFENCISLTGTIVIPDSVTEIAPGSFHECTNIADFNVTGIWDAHWLEATGSITSPNIALDKAKLLNTGYYYIRQP